MAESLVTLDRVALQQLRSDLISERDARLRQLSLDALVIEKMYVPPWRTGVRMPGRIQGESLRILDEYLRVD